MVITVRAGTSVVRSSVCCHSANESHNWLKKPMGTRPVFRVPGSDAPEDLPACQSWFCLLVRSIYSYKLRGEAEQDETFQVTLVSQATQLPLWVRGHT